MLAAATIASMLSMLPEILGSTSMSKELQSTSDESAAERQTVAACGLASGRGGTNDAPMAGKSMVSRAADVISFCFRRKHTDREAPNLHYYYS